MNDSSSHAETAEWHFLALVSAAAKTKQLLFPVIVRLGDVAFFSHLWVLTGYTPRFGCFLDDFPECSSSMRVLEKENNGLSGPLRG